MKEVRTVGELREALRDVGDDVGLMLQLAMPPSAKPSSFEDEYGPGTRSVLVLVQAAGHPGGGVVLHVGEDACQAVVGTVSLGRAR
jgi:hypothetical protein